MRIKNLPFLLVLMFPVVTQAQPQVYHFSELQRLLPDGNFSGYVRGRPTGETSSMMGFATSWAQVIYRSNADSLKSTIAVKITDMVSIPSYLSLTGDIDKETETGYERTVLYDDIRVLESYDSVSQSGKLQLPVASRFLVEITGTGIQSTTPLYALLDRIDLPVLEKMARPGESPR